MGQESFYRTKVRILKGSFAYLGILLTGIRVAKSVHKHWEGKRAGLQ